MNTVVETRSGTGRGAFFEGVHSFKGAPYAAPPFGDRRFRPPQPVEAWSGIHDALAFGPKAPSSLESSAQPVMVWIAGGAFEHGTGAAPYDGSRFARDGVVCMTMNYRVGADGFLYLGPEVANNGLLDQLAVLTRVRENIAAFGGDPDNVTVFGESAGAMSIGTLLSMPRARGLVHRAILQSGGAHQGMSAGTAARVSRSFAKARRRRNPPGGGGGVDRSLASGPKPH